MLTLLRNTPLRPLAAQMRKLAADCDSFDVATGFVSSLAVTDIVGAALKNGGRVRFLTGTFGAATRKSTFKQLLRLGKRQRLETRIWACSSHQRFHAKLYLWRMPGNRGVAWIGSANFTDGGLQSEGELLAEISGRWDGPELQALRSGFEKEWQRGASLNEEFVDAYREAERPPPDYLSQGGTRIGPSRARRRSKGDRAAFVTTVSHYFEEHSPVFKRVERILDGAAEHWMRHFVKSLSKLKVGQRGFLVDTVDHDIALIEITDVVRDGRAHVFSYLPVFKRSAWRTWNRATRRALAAAGLQSGARGPRTHWLSAIDARAIAKVLYPHRQIEL